MKKKLLYFSHGLSANGIESFLVNVFGKLNLEKYDVTVLIAIDEGVPSLHEQTVRDLGIKIINAGDMDGIRKKIKYIRNVKRELNKGNYDIVHSNMDLFNGITLYCAKKAGVKKRICHAHTTGTQYKSSGFVGIIKSIMQRCYASTMKFLVRVAATNMLTCSNEAGKYFYGSKDSVVIYNGINLDRFKDETISSDIMERELGLGDNDKRIVSVGRISDVKNPVFAVEIIAELKKIRSDFRYFWVGTGELEETVKEKINELGLQDTVVLTGVRRDVPQILNCCDLFLMTSLFEGLPFSLVEAQAAGLKCIVSDVVSEAADAGLIEFVSLEKSAAEWAEIISEQLDLPTPDADEEKMKKFDINYTVKQLEEIYDE